MSSKPALRVDQLSVVYSATGRSISAVDRVSLVLEPGKVLAVVGESGCGKSATAMAIMGLLPVNATVTGSVRIHDQELIGLAEPGMRAVRGRQLSVIFQEPMTSLNPVMRIGGQVVEVIRGHSRLSRTAAWRRAVELLDQVGIPEPRRRAREYPHQLSGGMRQRVMIAMAVACAPQVIIADEPTTALDVTVQATILQILRKLTRTTKTGVLLITHNLGVVADVADDVAVMYAGRIVEQAPVLELFAAPRHPYTRALLAATPVPGGKRKRLEEIPGVVPSLAEPARCCTFHQRCRRSVDSCVTTRPELGKLAVDHAVSCFRPFGEAEI